MRGEGSAGRGTGVLIQHGVSQSPGRDPPGTLRYDTDDGDRTVNIVSQPDPMARRNTLRSGPDGRGRFGDFGGRFVAETLMPLILAVEQAYEAAKADPSFQTELD